MSRLNDSQYGLIYKYLGIFELHLVEDVLLQSIYDSMKKTRLAIR